MEKKIGREKRGKEREEKEQEMEEEEEDEKEDEEVNTLEGFFVEVLQGQESVNSGPFRAEKEKEKGKEPVNKKPRYQL